MHYLAYIFVPVVIQKWCLIGMITLIIYVIWTVSKNDLAWPLQSESDPSEKKLFEHQKQKFRKLNEQLIDEKEKYSAAQREYYQLIQKSDKVRSNQFSIYWWNLAISRVNDHEFKLFLKNKRIIIIDVSAIYPKKSSHIVQRYLITICTHINGS